MKRDLRTPGLVVTHTYSIFRDTSLDQIPVVLDADRMAMVLGISRAKAYQLMHTDAFPTLRIGKRMVVRKEHFIAWMDKESGMLEEKTT